ncbi:hypothetical protein G6F32_014039 [Rhizopus arrhizus]|nr:hypothetical protein G6F32_014039 [Rhizopus arrhizus]
MQPASSRRKTLRKLPKAARAAGRERAAQDLPLPHLRRAEPKKLDSPRRPAGFSHPSPARGWPGVRGASISPRESEGTAAGSDEDDDGAVRSEGSGPQSLTRAPRPTATPGV